MQREKNGATFGGLLVYCSLLSLFTLTNEFLSTREKRMSKGGRERERERGRRGGGKGG